TLASTLVILLVSASFFSIAETAMMAANRHRLKHRAQQGERGARQTLDLLGQIDRLLGVILLGNTLVAAGAATLTAVITKRLFGEGELALALGTVAISFGLLVFSEIAPKVVGAAHADRIAPVVSYVLTPMLKAATPVVWFVNLFVRGVLTLLRVPTGSATGTTLTREELRSLVLEGQYFRGKHRAMLANLIDVGAVTVDDVMTPRNQIHAIDLNGKPGHLAEQLATSYHTRLPAYEDELDNIGGIVQLKQGVGLQQGGTVDGAALRSILRPAYFVPAGTPLLVQLQQFQTDRERLRVRRDRVWQAQGPPAPRCSSSCSSSRPIGRGSGSSSTNMASSRASSPSRTSSRRSSAISPRRRPRGARPGSGIPTAASSSMEWRCSGPSTGSSARIFRWMA